MNRRIAGAIAVRVWRERAFIVAVLLLGYAAGLGLVVAATALIARMA